MALAGNGAIIIWNDVAPEGRAEYYDWHNHEHMPERLGIPGFLRGSRYIALSPESRPEYLTLYELSDRSIATSAPYLARLNAPTDWSRSTMLHFRNMIRALTTVERSIGVGLGGVAASIRFEDSQAGAAAVRAIVAQPDLIAAIARMPRITGAHLCLTDTAASAAKTAESRHRNDSITAPIGVVLIEGCDASAVRDALAQLTKQCPIDDGGASVGIYALEHTLTSLPPR